MDRSSFFDKIGLQAKANEKAEADKLAAQLRKHEATRAVIPKVRPVLQLYADELRKRGIGAKFDDGESALSFELQYHQGGYEGLSFFEGQLTRTYGEKGLHYRSNSRDISNGIDQTELEKILQEVIQDFIQKAPSRGGHRAPDQLL